MRLITALCMLLTAQVGWSFGGHRNPFKALEHNAEVSTAIQHAMQKCPNRTWLTADSIREEVALAHTVPPPRILASASL